MEVYIFKARDSLNLISGFCLNSFILVQLKDVALKNLGQKNQCKIYKILLTSRGRNFGR